MNSIVIHPQTQEETAFLESLLKRMKFSFEKISTEQIRISTEEMQSVKRGISEADENKLIDNAEVHRKARALCSK